MIVRRSTHAAYSMIAVWVSSDYGTYQPDTLVFILTSGVTIQLGIDDLHTDHVPVFTKVVFHLP